MTDEDHRATRRTGPGLRVGDAERASCVDRLAAHATTGRLSVDELEERTAAAHAAVYAHELAALEADLPASVPQRRAERLTAPWWPGPLVVLVALLAVASIAAGHPVGLPLLLVFAVWRVGTRVPARSMSTLPPIARRN